VRIRYFCHYDKLTGYGRAARDYCGALVGQDLELEIVPLGAAPGTVPTSPEPRYAELDRLVTTEPVGTADVAIYHSLPRVLAVLAADWSAQEATRRIALTTWETSRFPDVHAQPIARGYDQIVVPSSFCQDALAESGVPSAIIPHCFDPGFWVPTRAGELSTPLRFYTIGAWAERKNPLGVLAAYLHAFTSADNVQLVMFHQGCDFDAVRSLLARTGVPQSELPELHVPETELSEQQLLELHDQADCFVSATRCEGFGLGMFEAAIMGRYVITPIYGGHEDFLLDYEGCLEVPYQRTPCFGSEKKGDVIERDGQKLQVARVALAPGVTCRQSWAEPDLIALADRMRELYQGSWRDVAGGIREDRLALEARFGYSSVGRLFADFCKEL